MNGLKEHYEEIAMSAESANSKLATCFTVCVESYPSKNLMEEGLWEKALCPLHHFPASVWPVHQDLLPVGGRGGSEIDWGFVEGWWGVECHRWWCWWQQWEQD